MTLPNSDAFVEFLHVNVSTSPGRGRRNRRDVHQPNIRKTPDHMSEPEEKTRIQRGPHTIDTPLQLLHVLAAVDRDIGTGHERRLVRA